MTERLYPQRIVCLAAEASEILDALGAFDRIAGVSGFARRPKTVRELPKVGGFRDPGENQILDLSPDLVITISDIQAEIAARLIKAGVPVLALNPHRLEDIYRSILLVGGAIGAQARAEQVAANLAANLEQLRVTLPADRRPRVYFEEWHEPQISGIGWVSDLIELVGGFDIFREHASREFAAERVVAPETVIERAPDVIIASWCGKKAELDSIRRRPGWETIPAVRHGRVYEIKSDDILQTGPSILDGARLLRHFIGTATSLVQNSAE